MLKVAITPTLISTSDNAKRRFSPEDRGCYFKDELPLLYLPSKFYRYEMSNCLFEAAYEEVSNHVKQYYHPNDKQSKDKIIIEDMFQILKQCNCTPSFHALGFKEKPVFCLGLQLTCMNDILKAIGKYNTVGPEKKPCLAACEDQVCVYISPRSKYIYSLPSGQLSECVQFKLSKQRDFH